VLTPPSPAHLATLASATERYAHDVDDALPYLAARGISRAVAARYQLGLVARPMPGHEMFAGRLAIPYLTEAGVVDIRFRALGEAHAKYLSLPGATPGLYNVAGLLRATTTCAITEGELDAVVCDGVLGVPAVGVPGVNAWQASWVRLFVDFDHVIIPCDGDEAGRGFGSRLAKVLNDVTVITLPDGQDISSLTVAEGADAVRMRLAV
jgi:DNA primase